MGLFRVHMQRKPSINLPGEERERESGTGEGRNFNFRGDGSKKEEALLVSPGAQLLF